MDARFPVGPLLPPERPDAAWLDSFRVSTRDSVAAWRETCSALSAPDLARTYREGSWTVRQLVHHVADAHEHGFMRLRWGLTESVPTILPFDEVTWAALPDYALPPEVSLTLLEAVQTRWLAVLDDLTPDMLDRVIRHPHEGEQTLWRLLAKHEWHLRHHLGHVRLALGTFTH